MKMTFKTEIFIYLLHPLKMTSDLLRFVHFPLNEVSVSFNCDNTLIVADWMHLAHPL